MAAIVQSVGLIQSVTPRVYAGRRTIKENGGERLYIIHWEFVAKGYPNFGNWRQDYAVSSNACGGWRASGPVKQEPSEVA